MLSETLEAQDVPTTPDSVLSDSVAVQDHYDLSSGSTEMNEDDQEIADFQGRERRGSLHSQIIAHEKSFGSHFLRRCMPLI